MAYILGDHRLVIRGTLSNGEVWFNTWAWRDTGSAVAQDVTDDFHAFYNTIWGLSNGISSQANAVGAVDTDLFAGIPTEMDWANITGGEAEELLPTQCAIRISLNGGTVRGGPFLAGWSTDSVKLDGTLLDALQASLATALGDLVTALGTHDAVLGIDRPTTETVVNVDRGRIGERFDVIRKRANDVAEAYAVVTI